jgi:predicted ATPase
VNARGGTIIKERAAGDSVFAAFSRASEAAMAACEIQLAIQEEPWGTPWPFRIRIALNTAELEPFDGDYIDPAVNLTARLRDLAHGGQIVMSKSTAELCQAHMSPQVVLIDLGARTLRGFERPVVVYQLSHPRLETQFPPLRSPTVLHGNLPPRLDTFIGRGSEIALIKRLLPRAGLVTLTGLGGSGKTRLAIEAARECRDRYPDGAWMLALDELADPDAIPALVARTLGIRQTAGHSIAEAVFDHLQSRRLLLILDNCEHIIGAATEFAGQVVDRLPGVDLLATSRESLRIHGEKVVPVGMLEMPAAHAENQADITTAESAALFLERVGERRPEFQVDRENAGAVRDICRALDGHPLALELAAARVGSVPLESIARWVTDIEANAPGQGMRLTPDRHRSLEAVFDWSYRGLTEAEQFVFNRLSVFAGSFDTEAVTAVVGPAPGGAEAATIVSNLAQHGLVQMRSDSSTYRMLKILREIGARHLASEGALDRVSARHAAWCRAWVLSSAADLSGSETDSALAAFKARDADINVALGWFADHGHAEDGMSMASALWRYWLMSGQLSVGMSRLEAFVRRGTGDSEVEGDALHGLGTLAYYAGRHVVARTCLEKALRLRRSAGDRLGEAYSLNNLGMVAYSTGGLDLAEQLYASSLAIKVSEDVDPVVIARSRLNVGLVSLALGNLHEAEALVGLALEAARQAHAAPLTVACLNGLGDISADRGDYGRSLQFGLEAMAFCRSAGLDGKLAEATRVAGAATDYLGQKAAARKLYQDSLAIDMRLGDIQGQLDDVAHLARLDLESGHHEGARRQYLEVLTKASAYKYTHGALNAQIGLALSLGLMGEVAQGLKMARGASRSARASGRCLDLALALETNGVLLGIAGRPHRVSQVNQIAASLRERTDSVTPPYLRALVPLPMAATPADPAD